MHAPAVFTRIPAPPGRGVHYEPTYELLRVLMQLYTMLVENQPQDQSPKQLLSSCILSSPPQESVLQFYARHFSLCLALVAQRGQSLAGLGVRSAVEKTPWLLPHHPPLAFLAGKRLEIGSDVIVECIPVAQQTPLC